MSRSSFVCTQLNGFEYNKWLNISINGTLTGNTTPGQSTSHSPKLQNWSLTIRWFSCRDSYPYAEMLSAYSTTPADWAIGFLLIYGLILTARQLVKVYFISRFLGIVFIVCLYLHICICFPFSSFFFFFLYNVLSNTRENNFQTDLFDWRMQQ